MIGPRRDRELSWLAFNGRVLQEAENPDVPLYERLNFLSIFSSNLDEFFRVRVAALRALLRLRRKRIRHLPVSPRELLDEIHRTVVDQQDRYGRVFRDRIVPELRAQGVVLGSDLTEHPEAHEELSAFFDEAVRPELRVRRLGVSGAATPEPVFLEDRGIHLVVSLGGEGDILRAPTRDHVLVAIPAPPLSRFRAVDTPDGHRLVVFLDDLIRWKLPDLFPGDRVLGAWSVKLSRDAELGVEDEFDGDLVEAIRRSLKKRDQGLPSRFLHDQAMPAGLLSFLMERLDLQPEDLVEGGRYHNLHDLRQLPRPRGPHAALHFPAWPPVPHPALNPPNPPAAPVVEATAEADRLLHLPYQGFGPIVRFLDEAARDSATREIFLTIYRVADDSRVLRTLLDASARGIEVTVFCEVQARFDEAANVRWGDRLAASGVRALYGSLGRKVHAKVALVRREEDGALRNYAFLGTGNFNEDTARIYADLGLFTVDPRLTDDVHRVVRHLAGELPEPTFEHLWVAPFDLRERVLEAIARETAAARAGKPSGIDLKLNALEDHEVIEALAGAVEAGVPVRGVVRGICCLVPHASGGPPNLRLRSVVGRYLEHARIYRFHAGGEDRVFLASADWMHRNLDRRLEVAFPLYDPAVKAQAVWILETQLEDRPQARIIDSAGENPYPSFPSGTVSAQDAHRAWLQDRAGAPQEAAHD
ncbi:MAG TPA: polyphosphate kinase 1 [Longimicrobiales bacterium]|nr:polyphosphate kinase 1 [Longimicrobiales bacterium]